MGNRLGLVEAIYKDDPDTLRKIRIFYDLLLEIMKNSPEAAKAFDVGAVSYTGSDIYRTIANKHEISRDEAKSIMEYGLKQDWTKLLFP